MSDLGSEENFRGGESGAIYGGVDEAINVFGSGGNQGNDRPAAYLNYILFDKHYNVLDAGWQLAPDVTFTKQKLSFPTKEIDQEGYMFVYLSYDNDSPNWVYFDDLKVTHTKTNVIQYNEYYPFGLQTEKSWTRTDNSNRFLYNAGSELNPASGWYETFFRGYDAALGRFGQVDPAAAASGSLSPYNFGFNNPVVFNDPNGDYPLNTYKPMTYDWDGPNGTGGSFYPSFGSHKFGQHFYGAGSVHDWFRQYASTERNAEFMSHDAFNDYYNIKNDQDRADVANNASTTIYENGKFTVDIGVNGNGDGNGNIIPGTEVYIIYSDGFSRQAQQDPYQADLTEFLQFFFGDEIRELSNMGRLTWYIDYTMKYTKPGQPGDTKSLNDGRRAAISLNPVLFTDARKLYTTVAHELMHARDILNGNEFEWMIKYGAFDTKVIMEYHGYLRSAELEGGFGVDYGSAEALQILGPLLPSGFNY